MPYSEPLFMCVQRGELKYLIELLSKHPDGINDTDETGQTILHCACAQGKFDIVIYLLNKCNCEISRKEQLYGYTPLHVACVYDQARVVLQLVKKINSESSGVDIKDNFGWTALHHAARNGNIDICKSLISGGAQVDICNKLGKTPCHYAAQYGHLSTLKYLFDYCEKKLTPPVIPEGVLTEPTLLHCAALRNNTAIVDWLIKQKTYPPTVKCKRTVNFDEERSRDELAEEVAAGRGYAALRGTLSAYRVMYEEWIQDISKDKVTLDRIKLCICGHPRVGKSAMRQSLSKPYLQSLLGKDVVQTTEDNVERHTFGIEISSMQLSGKDLFSVWDFAGQVESFITHQFFISTQSTVFTVLVNLSKPVAEQRAQLMFWLGFIKMRNLGQIPFSPGPLDIEKDIVPMPSRRQDVYRLLPMRSWTRKSFRHGRDQDEEPQLAMYGSVLQPVPVIIVGSHYDQIAVEKQQKVISDTEILVNEMKERFEEYLDISQHLYPLNCLKAVSPEIKVLKERLCEVRAKLVEVQPQYPRVIELVARKIESLRVEHPNLKVLSWSRVKEIVRDDLNRLLSERQLSYVFKCLANAGVLVYFDQGALANYVFIDPGWLCQDVLGKALAPGSFPVSRIAAMGSVQISEKTLQAKFAEHVDKQHVPVIIELLQHFELCHRLKENDLFEFPCFITNDLDPQLWKEDVRFVGYVGRNLVCTDDTDSFPPGFFSRLQVQVSGSFKQGKPHLFNGSFVLDGGSYQCLVKINYISTAIELIGRTELGSSQNCLQLMDQIQALIAALIRSVCPTIFLQFEVLSSSDLKHHRPKPYSYSILKVVAAEVANALVINEATGDEESPTDLLYLGDVNYQEAHKGQNRKVAYIPDEIVEKVQELLRDGTQDKDWRSLAKAINLEQYIQLLESRAPESTRLLLVKWAEKPRWTVQSLLYALKEIGNIDAYNFVRARIVKCGV